MQLFQNILNHVLIKINIVFHLFYRILTGGKISDHNIQNGSKVTLLPAVESGFSVSSSKLILVFSSDLHCIFYLYFRTAYF